MPPIHQRFTSKPTEADTCRKYVVPKLQAAGWEIEPHSIAEQRQFTAGRIVVAGTKATRQEARKADYLLRYTPDFAIAVVEAKAEHKLPADGLQQSKEYAQTLGLKFAYATNGTLRELSADEIQRTERHVADGSKPSPLSNWPKYPGGAIAGALLAVVSILIFVVPALRDFLPAAPIVVVVLWVLWGLRACRSDD